MTDLEYKYMETQLIKAIPLPPQDCGQIKIKLYSELGQSNWLNISPETLKKIELALLEDA
jgi:hypothetical protein